MKKSQIIIIICICLLVITAAGAMYYFYFYQGKGTVVPVRTEPKAVEGEEISTEGFDEGEEEEPEAEVDEQLEETGDEDRDISEEGQMEEEAAASVEGAGDDSVVLDYSYRNTFRNPFRDYRVRVQEVHSEEVLTLAEIKARVPFKIQGIIGNNYQRIAVLDYAGKTLLIKKQTEIEGYRIIDILENGLLLLYRGVQFKLEMESDIGEG
ncbi:MAG: hypothetical protein GX175_01470 [Halanaerobiaceae bacterium]|nr:hypothetical protein [Halanaerobiaceae bacterium]